MAVALPKDDWTPAKLKTHQEWRKRMYGAPSVKAIPVRALEATISPPWPQPVEKAEIRVQVHFGYPMLPMKEYKHFKFKMIQRAVCASADVTMGEMVSQLRQHRFVKARMIAIMLCKMFGGPDASMPVIARAFGGRDHTSILHALRKTDAVAKALERRVPPDAPLPQFVSAAFDAWDELVEPIYEKNREASRQRVAALPRTGQKWNKK